VYIYAFDETYITIYIQYIFSNRYLDIRICAVATEILAPCKQFLHFRSSIIHAMRTRRGKYIRVTTACPKKKTTREVAALGVITISRGYFERCGSNKKIPPCHSNLSFVTLRNRRPTLLRAPAYRTPCEASPRRRCGHASQFLRKKESGKVPVMRV